jgi:hypothetical protein
MPWAQDRLNRKVRAYPWSNDDRRDHPDLPVQQISHPRNVHILPPSRDFH